MLPSSTVMDLSVKRLKRCRTTQTEDAEKPERTAETEDAKGSQLPDEAAGVRKSTRAKKPNPKYRRTLVVQVKQSQRDDCNILCRRREGRANQRSWDPQCIWRVLW